MRWGWGHFIVVQPLAPLKKNLGSAPWFFLWHPVHVLKKKKKKKHYEWLHFASPRLSLFATVRCPCLVALVKQFNKIMLASTLDDANYAINLLQVSTTKFWAHFEIFVQDHPLTPNYYHFTWIRRFYVAVW